MFTQRTALLAFALCSFVSVGLAHDFTVCDGITDDLKITAVDLSPDPPAAGKSLTVKVTGGPTSVAVTGGEATLNGFAFNTHIYGPLSFDICTDFGVKCPVAAGDSWDGQISYPIPSVAPKGLKLSLKVDITDEKNQELSCFKIETALGSQSWFDRIGSSLSRRLAAFSMYLGQ